MPGNQADPLLIEFWKAVPKAQLQELQKVHKLSVIGDPAEALSKMPGLITALLCTGSFELPELQTMASAIDAKNVGKTKISTGNAILNRLREHRREQRLGSRLSMYQELWTSACRFARRITLLRSEPSSPQELSPVAFFNPEAAEGELWIIVDLQHHPNPKVACAKTILVSSVDCELGAVDELPIFECPEGWIPLFPYPFSEMPRLELLELLVPKNFAFPADAEILQVYDAEVQETSLVSGIHLFHSTATLPYDGIYSQLGGFPHAWPEGNEDWEMKAPLIVRTYANSEPWTEVYLRGKSYTVFQRIS